MNYTKNDIKPLKRKRAHIKEAIQRYYNKGYDARPLLKSYEEISEVLIGLGCNLGDPPQYCRPEEWKNPVRWCNHSRNKHPVLGVDEDFNIIREGEVIIKERRPSPSMQPKTKYIEQREEPRQDTTKEIEKGYYRINISWTERLDVNRESISKIQIIFKELGLELVRDCAECGNHTIEYRFQGTYEEYALLKRTAMATLDALAGTQEFNITIHGQKI